VAACGREVCGRHIVNPLIPMKLPPKSPDAFTLMELLVVIVIIAVLAGLLFPVFARVKRNGIEARTVSNLRQIGTAIAAYCGDHDGMLPGPLTVEQYPTFGSDPKRDAGSLAMKLANYLSLSPKKEGDKGKTRAGDLFACPGSTEQDLDEVVGYIMNMERIIDYEQPAWGELGSSETGEKAPLTRAALTSWRETATNVDNSSGTVLLSRRWAMRHTDQEDCKKLKLEGKWVEKLPKEPVFDDHYQVLFFDLHVERYQPKYDNSDPNTR
jgi:prepilin-type N-terminal cleavage/methylation domain-containing protein